MKKSLLLIVMAIFIGSNYYLSAQEMVSTDPQLRNVILEEFTGIHCGYCPDGHKIATELAASNPGRVFLINIHAGGYAVPKAGEPDLRTTEGEQIDNAAGVTGYPAGSVNRSTSPWAMNRGQWVSVATSQILPNISPVNVAVKAEVDFDTRELTATVEYYYTSNSPLQTNYLTVVLTQSGILGYQSDYGNYNPDNWVGDQYSHNHALRMVLSDGGAFGESITETTAGTFGTKTYKTILPETIKDIDVNLVNLNVTAFVSESQANIYSGHGVDVEYDKSKVVDLAINNLTETPQGFCFTSIHPIVEVTNMGQAVDGFDIVANIDGMDYVKTYEGTVAQDETVTIDWGEMAYTPKGVYSIKIEGFDNISGGTLFDMISGNNSDEITGIGFTQKAFGLYNAGFNSSTMPLHTAFDFSQNPNFRVYLLTNPYGANGSVAGVQFSIHSSWGVAGKPGYIMFGEADLSQVNNPSVGLYYAYSDGSQGGTAPTIKVEVSEDCGDNWTEIGSEVVSETGQPSNPQYYYVPTSNEWRKLNFSLDEYAGKSVLIRVGGIPGSGGNALYIDEISVESIVTSVEVVETNELVYPNPAVNELTINNKDYTGKNFMIYSILGEVVNEGIFNGKIDVSNLTAGSYMIYIDNKMIRFMKK